jgi:hypothetical protein
LRLITPQEKQEMHDMLDMCIDKMSNDKNCLKPHWKQLSLKELRIMIDIENRELDLAIFQGDKPGIVSELKDVVNLAIFALHNIFKG